VWANDIEPIKHRLYAANFADDHYALGDVRDIHGGDLPEINLATASFPCTDLSLAGWRRGLAGEQSGMFWEFARILDEMADRRPSLVLLENVPGFVTSRGGKDMLAVVERLNTLGYICDIFQMDARGFVPQSRPRLFIVGSITRIARRPVKVDEIRTQRIIEFALAYPWLELQAMSMPLPAPSGSCFADVVERLPSSSPQWWVEERQAAFTRSLSPVQAKRLEHIRQGARMTWRTAYRRTRDGVAMWEIRSDQIAGCLRTAKGGSSKQAVVEAGRDNVRVRWMTAREYARLQGVPDSFNFGGVPANQVMFGFGDAVCVSVVAWIAEHYLKPLLVAHGTRNRHGLSSIREAAGS